jgi:hypothetical protein
MDAPGEARRLTEIPTGASAPRWVGQHIYFASNVWPDSTWDAMKGEMERRRASHVSAHTWNALPTSAWDRWIDETRQAHLYRIPASGGEMQSITVGTGYELPRAGPSLASYDVAPDESLIVFQADTHGGGVTVTLDLLARSPG